jgi:hypothetical protein
MKQPFIHFVAICGVVASLISCHSSGSNQGTGQDVRTTADTAIIPGTPGPSGTAPRPGDTSRAHRDSLRRAVNALDSAGGPRAKP